LKTKIAFVNTLEVKTDKARLEVEKQLNIISNRPNEKGVCSKCNFLTTFFKQFKVDTELEKALDVLTEEQKEQIFRHVFPRVLESLSTFSDNIGRGIESLKVQINCLKDENVKLKNKVGFLNEQITQLRHDALQNKNLSCDIPQVDENIVYELQKIKQVVNFMTDLWRHGTEYKFVLARMCEKLYSQYHHDNSCYDRLDVL